MYIVAGLIFLLFVPLICELHDEGRLPGGLAFVMLFLLLLLCAAVLP